MEAKIEALEPRTSGASFFLTARPGFAQRKLFERHAINQSMLAKQAFHVRLAILITAQIALKGLKSFSGARYNLPRVREKAT
jgi:hypothetical protein